MKTFKFKHIEFLVTIKIKSHSLEGALVTLQYHLNMKTSNFKLKK